MSFHDTSRNPLAPFEAAVKKSRRAFVEKLAEYHATLACAIISAPDADQSEPFVDAAMFVAHRIAGVGKTLGFAELGEAARRAEVAIAAYEKDLGSAERHSVCHARICQLASIIEAICADHDDCHGRLRPRR
ncbi:Hpt domain-containing protein [Maritimibacter sp. HL-12]|nr:Hpt domain-containing protein [Maritimibacter sp. HL-12]